MMIVTQHENSGKSEIYVQCICTLSTLLLSMNSSYQFEFEFKVEQIHIKLRNLLNSNVSISRKTQILGFSVDDNQNTITTVLLYYLVYLDVVRVQFRSCVVPGGLSI